MKMCKPVRDYAEERARIAASEAADMRSVQFVDTLLNKGFSFNEALEIVNIDEETYNKYKSV